MWVPVTHGFKRNTLGSANTTSDRARFNEGFLFLWFYLNFGFYGEEEILAINNANFKSFLVRRFEECVIQIYFQSVSWIWTVCFHGH